MSVKITIEPNHDIDTVAAVLLNLSRGGLTCNVEHGDGDDLVNVDLIGIEDDADSGRPYALFTHEGESVATPGWSSRANRIPVEHIVEIEIV